MGLNEQILHIDDAILVINKPAGRVVIPERWETGEVALWDEAQATHGTLLVVHRLDRDTTGALVFARTPAAHTALCTALESGGVEKKYHALCKGDPREDDFTCGYGLVPDGDRQHRTIIDNGAGKPSVTEFTVLERFRKRGKAFALVEARPRTGRTHQVRVHATASGCPILCDPLYGDGEPLKLSDFKAGRKGDPFDERPLLSRTALHAFSLEFTHPSTGHRLRIEAPYPRDFAAALAQLRKALGRKPGA
jgi:RluA family pseudouridine synthase